MTCRTHVAVLALALAAPPLAACGGDVVAGDSGAGSGGAGGASSSVAETVSTATTGMGSDSTVGASCEVESSLRCGDGEDLGTILECVGGAYEAAGQCAPDAPCANVQGAETVVCGTTFLGIEGTPCNGAATKVCDFGRDVVLSCDDGTWTTSIHCAPVRCIDVPAAAGELCSGSTCEGCSYTVGDRCSFPSGTVTCSTDGSEIVGCEGGIVTLHEDCGTVGLLCTRVGPTIECQ